MALNATPVGCAMVTGGGGFIGGHVRESLLSAYPQMRVVTVGRKDDPYDDRWEGRHTHVRCDLEDRQQVDAISEEEVEVVVHLAGDRRTFLAGPESAAQWASNVGGTVNVAEYAIRKRAKLLVYASSVYVYSGCSSLPFQEEAVALPVEMLGASKLAAESYLKCRAGVNGLKVLVCRIFTVYGPGAGPSQLVPQAIAKLKGEGDVANFGLADVGRDFTYVGDVARAIVLSVAELDHLETFDVVNIGSGEMTRIGDFVEQLAAQLRSSKRLSFDLTGKRRAGDVDHQADIRKAARLLQWAPQYPLQQGLEDTLLSFRST